MRIQSKNLGILLTIWLTGCAAPTASPEDAVALGQVSRVEPAAGVAHPSEADPATTPTIVKDKAFATMDLGPDHTVTFSRTSDGNIGIREHGGPVRVTLERLAGKTGRELYEELRQEAASASPEIPASQGANTTSGEASAVPTTTSNSQPPGTGGGDPGGGSGGPSLPGCDLETHCIPPGIMICQTSCLYPNGTTSSSNWEVCGASIGVW